MTDAAVHPGASRHRNIARPIASLPLPLPPTWVIFHSLAGPAVERCQLVARSVPDGCEEGEMAERLKAPVC